MSTIPEPGSPEQIAQLEASVDRVFAAVHGLREDEAGLVLAIAQYAFLWMAADAHASEPRERTHLIDALLATVQPAGRAYAEAMIAQGHIWGRIR